jgi:hypothetical protein
MVVDDSATIVVDEASGVLVVVDTSVVGVTGSVVDVVVVG